MPESLTIDYVFVQARNLLLAAGFKLDKASKRSESEYYSFSGRFGKQIRLSAHSTRPQQNLICLTIDSTVQLKNIEETTALVIGYYFLKTKPRSQKER